MRLLLSPLVSHFQLAAIALIIQLAVRGYVLQRVNDVRRLRGVSKCQDWPLRHMLGEQVPACVRAVLLQDGAGATEGHART